MEGLRPSLLLTRFYPSLSGLPASRLPVLAVIVLLSLVGQPRKATSAEAQWIWATGSSLSKPIPAGETCYFRKSINLRTPGEGLIEIAADDQYELYLNEELIGRGKTARKSDATSSRSR